MHRSIRNWGKGLGVGVLALSFAAAPAMEAQQAGGAPTAVPVGTQAGAASGTTQPAALTRRKSRRRRRRVTRPSTGPLPTPNQVEQPSSPADRAQAAQQAAMQRQRDAALLKQQQADSQRQQNHQDRDAAQHAKQVQSQQSAPGRIEDAPGPSQTGVPGVPPSSQPAPGIQDAPGPSQTLPTPPQ
jgi:hypothetical protein